MAYQTILFERNAGVATITFNRPQAMNSLSSDLLRDVAAALASCENDSEVRAVIITGTGRAFCAGADLREFSAQVGEGLPSFLYGLAAELHDQVVVPIRRMAKPVIAAVNGVAAGAGLGMVLCCDVRIASADARFTVAYSNIGLSPDCGTTYFLPRLVGAAKAMDLYLFNDILSAEQAQQLGILSRVVPADNLMASAQETANRLAAGPSFAYGQTKHLLNKAFSNDLAGQLVDEARAVALCSSSADHREGLEAFLGKRPPQFKGK